MRNRQLAKLVLSIIVLMALIVGCGGSESAGVEPAVETPTPGESAGVEPAVETPTPGEATATAEPTTIPERSDVDVSVPQSSGAMSWDPDRKALRPAFAGITEPPTVTNVLAGEFETMRVQWFDDALAVLTPQGVNHFERDGTGNWSWEAPMGIDDLDRDHAVRFENQMVFLSGARFDEQLVGLDLASGAMTEYGVVDLGSPIGPTATGIWGLNASGDFIGLDLGPETADVEFPFREEVWHVDTNGPVAFSDRATAVGFVFDDDSDDYINELRWYDLDSGTQMHAPNPEQHRIAVELGDDEVYAISRDDDDVLTLYSYDLETGAVRWSIEVPDADDYGALTAINGDLVALAAGETVVVYDAVTGSELWREDGDLLYDDDAAPFVENAPGALVAVSDAGGLYARDLVSGNVLWQSIERRVDGQLFVADTVVYVINARRATVQAFALESGALLWSVELDADTILTADFTNGALALGTNTGAVVLR